MMTSHRKIDGIQLASLLGPTQDGVTAKFSKLTMKQSMGLIAACLCEIVRNS